MDATDNRAVSTPDIETVLAEEAERFEAQNTPDLPPGLHVLTPEELAARESEAAGEATPEEAQAAIQKVMDEVKEREAALSDQLAKIGTFVMVRFEHTNSLNTIVQTSKPAPNRQTMIAVFTALVKELDGYNLYEALEEAKRTAQKEVVLPSEEQKHQLNREERRFLSQIERKLRG